jgi:hypothetical protein
MSDLEIAALPIAQKLQLMESLWDSLCRETSGGPDVPSWHGEVLAERIRRLDNGEEPVSSWADAKQRIREQTESK